MVVLYNGPPSASRKYTQSFHDLLLLSASTDEVEYPDHPAAVLSSQKDLACQKLGDSSSALRFPTDLKSYNISAMRSIYEIFDNGITNEPQLSTSLMMIEGYSVQGVQAIPENSTAVPFRAERLLLSPTIFFSDTGGANLQATALSWGKNIREVLREGEGETLSYVNYAHGDEGPGAWYGHEHWRIEKLKTLKKVWDPQNKFGGYAPIPVD